MQPITYLFFDNTCRAAMTRYGEIFGTTPEILGFDGLPPNEDMPPMPKDAVMHAAVAIGDGWLYGSDDPTGATPAMAGCNISVSLDTEAETRRIFEALAEGGEVRMPLKPEFWAPLYGALTDQFGIRWMVMMDAPQG